MPFSGVSSLDVTVAMRGRADVQNSIPVQAECLFMADSYLSHCNIIIWCSEIGHNRSLTVAGGFTISGRSQTAWNLLEWLHNPMLESASYSPVRYSPPDHGRLKCS